jgi:hypothetical protein
MWIRSFLLVAIFLAGCGGKQPAPPPSNTPESGTPPATQPGSGAAPALCDDPDCETGGIGTCYAICVEKGGSDDACSKKCSPEAMCPKVPCPD